MELSRGHERAGAELISYAILGHHAGLPDKHNETGQCFDRRLDSFANKLDPVWKTELPHDLTGLLSDELLEIIKAAGPCAKFDFSVVARMIFSCLVDADFKDSEAYYVAREHREADRSRPSLASLLPGFISAFDGKVSSLPKEGDLNRLRGDILSHVRHIASNVETHASIAAGRRGKRENLCAIVSATAMSKWSVGKLGFTSFLRHPLRPNMELFFG